MVNCSSLNFLYSTLSGFVDGKYWEDPPAGIQIRILEGGFDTSLRGVLADFIHLRDDSFRVCPYADYDPAIR